MSRNLRRFFRNSLTVPALLVLLALLVAALFAPQLATHQPNRQDFVAMLQPPSAAHWLGTDELGRDIFSRVLFGARISVTVALLAVGLGSLVGVAVGLVAGFYGGTIDNLLMRVIDVLLAFPGILLALLIASTMGAGLTSIVVAVAAYSVPTFARIMRGSVLAVKSREFVEAARAAGSGTHRILLQHILLNSFTPVLVYATLLMGSAILTAAALSFLGVGIRPPTAEWGAMISAGRSFMRQAPHIILGPGVAIFSTVLAFNILGDALRDTLDPKR
jgi:ABC-type dipeptide/oligopeptide/nickel transport system permease subunit